jgi:phosphoenolpyruvate carboxykinase (ATP)
LREHRPPNPQAYRKHYESIRSVRIRTAKVAGTEVGVTEPQATFSACFGAPFLVWHPAKYAELLASKMKQHKVNVWLVNTGWSGGSYGHGSRIKLQYTRAIIDGIYSGALTSAASKQDSTFGFEVVAQCPNVPKEILIPEEAWKDRSAYRTTAQKLAGLFVKNFAQYENGVSEAVRAAGRKT